MEHSDGQCLSNTPVANAIIIQGLVADDISDKFSCGQINVVVTDVAMVADPLPVTIVTSSLTLNTSTTTHDSSTI